MTYQRMAERRGSAMVKQYLHVIVCRSRHKTFLGVTQDQLDLFSGHPRKPLEEFIELVPHLPGSRTGPAPAHGCA